MNKTWLLSLGFGASLALIACAQTPPTTQNPTSAAPSVQKEEAATPPVVEEEAIENVSAEPVAEEEEPSSQEPSDAEEEEDAAAAEDEDAVTEPTKGENADKPADEETAEEGTVDQSAAPEAGTESQAPAQSAAPEAGVVAPLVIRMTVENWRFTPDAITVRKGEAVKIELVGMSGTHSFAIPDLGIDVPVNEGETVSVDLPTDKAGSFSFRCAVSCGEGHSGMTGMITVAE